MGRPPDMCCGTISNIRNCDLELSMNRSCTGTNEADEGEGGREEGPASSSHSARWRRDSDGGTAEDDDGGTGGRA